MNQAPSSFNFLTLSTGNSMIVTKKSVPASTCKNVAFSIREGLITRKPVELFPGYLSGVKLSFEVIDNALKCSLFSREDHLIIAFLAAAEATPAVKELYGKLHQLDVLRNPATREAPEGAFCAVAITAYGMIDPSVAFKAADMERCLSCAWLFGYCDFFKNLYSRPS